MSNANLSPEILKKSIFDLVSECREKMQKGIVDIAAVEGGVRAYCEAIASLPKEQGKLHKDDLNELMSVITKLGEELVVAREATKQELASLERLRKANVAYNSSDTRGGKFKKKEEE